MLARVKSFFTRKKIIWTAVIVVVLFGGWFLFGGKSNTSGIQTDTVKRQDIQKTVLTTGQVVSATDLNLSLQSSGVVRQVLANEGDAVFGGQTLVVLDQSAALANLQSAEGSLASAQANYDKIVAAATDQDIAVSQATVDTASTTLENAKQNLIRDIGTADSGVNSAVLLNTNGLFSSPQSASPQFGLAGTVQTNNQLVGNVNAERVSVNSALVNWQNEISGLNENNLDAAVTDSAAYISTVRNYLTDLLSLLTSYTQITTGGSQATLTADEDAITSSKTTVDSANTTITNDYQAIQNAENSLNQAQAALALKQAPARPEDVEMAKAQVLSAEGAVASAETALNNTVLRAPTDGTITQVDIKLGEQAQAGAEVMKLLNVNQLHTEALVSESDIASVAVGQTIDNTFDALGPDKHFETTVLTVNPASTIISGVVDYKVTGSLEKIPDIKPGMTDNETIMVAQKSGALTVPSSAVINQNGQNFVKVVDDPKKKTYHSAPVQIGLEADGGLTEILSGLTEGQMIVIYIK